MNGAEPSHRAGYFAIPADHPALAGHFPGSPVVPGVVLVDLALGVLQRTVPSFVPTTLRHGKFLAPVLPGQQIEVRYRPDRTGGYVLACLRDGQTVASFALAETPA